MADKSRMGGHVRNGQIDQEWANESGIGAYMLAMDRRVRMDQHVSNG